MEVNVSYNSLLYRKTYVGSPKRQKEGCLFKLPEKSIQKHEEHQSNNIWGELSKKYNIRDASARELAEISTKLYNAGQIPLFDHAVLTFDPNLSPQSIRFNISMINFNPDGRKDWIVEYEERALRDLKNSNTTGYTQNKRIVEILKRLI
ncbi:MAG: hypothetical protein GX958_06645 [Desulfitobacterium sp.]|nr:hypothetical protein [Desulfitobacterium sp.]